jgi:hypothetical protein
MDRWAWDQLAPWLTLRSALPVGALFCILRGPTRGGPGRPPAFAPNFTRQPLALASGGASRRTSYATPMRWRCPARASRCS